MKKLIALFAVTSMASTAAVAGIALSGTASVSYDDNGSTASTTSYDADLKVVGTVGTSTLTYGMDIDGANPATTSAVLATTIGPVTVSADMFNEVSTSATTNTTGGSKVETEGRSVTVSLSAPIGDATIALDNSGDITVSGTWSGVTISHTVKDGGDTTTGSASIAGMDVSITNKAGASTWTLGTTVAGVDITLSSAKAVTATFGLTGNTMTVSHTPAAASAASTTAVYVKNAVAAYSTVAIARDLTSGAALSATYSTLDDSLTLKASVAF